MTTDIFIKTFKKDFPFLRYCLLSIQKFCTGFNEVVIVCPNQDVDLLRSYGFPDIRVVGVEEKGKGYMFQQVCKLKAFNYCNAGSILYVDSDCVFTKPSTPEDFMIDGKPMLLRTLYSKPGMPVFWQSTTEKSTGFKSDWEYMRRHPMMHLRSVLMDLPDMEKYILEIPNHDFSEFNYIGQMIEKNYSDKYSIVNTDEFLPEKRLEQFRSWDGMTEQTKQLIEGYLK